MPVLRSGKGEAHPARGSPAGEPNPYDRDHAPVRAVILLKHEGTGYAGHKSGAGTKMLRTYTPAFPT